MNRRMLLAAVLAAAAAAHAQSALVLEDANLIDGKSDAARAHIRIIIRGDRIAAIQEASAPMPADAVIWNLHGMTVIPGLIDAHVHLTSGPGNQDQIAEVLQFGLLGGVTTVRDMGGDDIVLAELAKTYREPAQIGPRIFFSALVAGKQWFSDPRPKAASHGGTPGEVAWMRAITPESNLPAILAAAKATGATGLKIYADLPPAIVASVTAEAHRQGLRVWSHSAIFPARPSEVVAAGVDVVSHSVYLGDEGMSHPLDSYEAARRGLGIDYAATPVDGPAITALLRQMKERGTILDETLFVTNLSKRAADDPVWLWTVAVTRRAHQMGVMLAAGTDGFGNPARDAVPNIHREMQLLVDSAGLTPVEAIAAATVGAAKAIGMEKSYGAVETGKAADLVILRNDPSADIRKTQDIAAVVKGGVIYQR